MHFFRRLSGILNELTDTVSNSKKPMLKLLSCINRWTMIIFFRSKKIKWSIRFWGCKTVCIAANQNRIPPPPSPHDLLLIPVREACFMVMRSVLSPATETRSQFWCFTDSFCSITNTCAWSCSHLELGTIICRKCSPSEYSATQAGASNFTSLSPEWGTVDAEIKVPLFEAWSRSE